MIDRSTGLVERYAAGGRLLLQGGAPNFTRAPTDNDLGTGPGKTHAVWKQASEERKVERIEARKLADGGAEITVRYATAAATFVSRYRMAGDGHVMR